MINLFSPASIIKKYKNFWKRRRSLPRYSKSKSNKVFFIRKTKKEDNDQYRFYYKPDNISKKKIKRPKKKKLKNYQIEKPIVFIEAGKHFLVFFFYFIPKKHLVLS